jgi:hypothetical protein
MWIEGHIAHVSQAEELNQLRNIVNASKGPAYTAFYSSDPIMYSQENETRWTVCV